MTHRFVKRIFFALPALMLALAGCVNETETDAPKPAAGKEAVLTVSVPGMKAPSTRALDDAKEKEVADANLVIFDNTTHTLLEHYRIGGDAITAAGGANDWQLKVSSVENPSDITVAVIANASVEVAAALSTVAAGNSGTWVGADKTAFLAALQVANSAKWNTSAAGYWAIPMYGETTVVGSIYGGAVPTITLTRMLAKVDVANSVAPADPQSPTAGKFELLAVHVVNYNTAGLVAPAWDANGAPTGTTTAANLPADPGTRPWADGRELTYTPTAQAITDEIYLFESPALSGSPAPASPDGLLRLVFEGEYTDADGVTAHYYYPVDFTTGAGAYMPVLRNNRYLFTITEAAGRGYDRLGEAVAAFGVVSNLRTSLVVVDESGIRHMVWNGEHFLGVSEEELTLGYGVDNTGEIAVSTNYTAGWQVDRIEYDANGTDWLTATKDGASGDLRADLVLATTTINNDIGRTATVHLIAGRLTHSVTVTQRDGPPVIVDPGTTTDNSSDILSYVGAFWRADQRAERLIRIPITNANYAGKWAVQVLDHGGFADGDILFSAWDGNLPADPTDPDDLSTPLYVDDNKTYETGTATYNASQTEYIAFRVGLKQTIAADAHRYARIVVSFGSGGYNYNRVIYLRQGDAPDYLFRNNNDEDAIGGVQRTLSKPYSPYNLTAPAYRTDGGASSATGVAVGTRGGAFTEYPTQAGSFWNFAPKSASNTTTAVPYIYAMSPTTPNNSGGNTSIPTGFIVPSDATYWGLNSTLTATNPATSAAYNQQIMASIYETCPRDYRRPTDGSATNTAAVPVSGAGMPDPTNSEMGQSLWLNPVSGTTQITTASGNLNAAYGYYADGFFDRRTPRTQAASTSAQSDAAVDTDTPTVAYRGMLFYNPATSGSIFFPAPGYRNLNGYLIATGHYGSYWSSSASSTDFGWPLYFYNGTVYRNSTYRHYGFSVRCVYDPTP